MHNLIKNYAQIQTRKFQEYVCLGLKKLAQEIVKIGDWQEFLEKADDDCFEEVLLQGFVIAYCKIETDEKLKYIKWFVPKIDSWSITDAFCPALKIEPQDLEKVWKFVLPYLKSEKEFDVRFAVVMMLEYYITDEYVDKELIELDNVKHEGYYVKMAVAWCMAEIGIQFNDKAMVYLKGENHLDKFTYNKTLQKMRESYRIESKQKEILKQMKRQKIIAKLHKNILKQIERQIVFQSFLYNRKVF